MAARPVGDADFTPQPETAERKRTSARDRTGPRLAEASFLASSWLHAAATSLAGTEQRKRQARQDAEHAKKFSRKELKKRRSAREKLLLLLFFQSPLLAAWRLGGLARLALDFAADVPATDSQQKQICAGQIPAVREPAMNASEIKTIAVIGAGQMGSGIAQVAAGKGLNVILCDASADLAKKSKDRIGKILGKLVAKGKMAPDEVEALLGRITPVQSSDQVERAELVVEAATENLDVKVALFKALDAKMKPGAILASNTSSISITRLAGQTSRPSDVIGMHFMNPVPLMKLVEIVRGVQTSDATYATVRELAEKLDKTVITSKDQPGFVVNRMLVPFLNEACFALQEGLGTPEDIDLGAKLGLNHPMGPLELADLIGLDTLLFIAEVLHREFGDDKYRPATLLRNLVAAGWYGRKVGRGFYIYDEKGQKTGRAFER
jgi:3-hydroxybutyryl-CoA dehydrogenase